MSSTPASHSVTCGDYESARRDCKAHVIGSADSGAGEEPQLLTAKAVLQAFGDDSAATICLEAKRSDARDRPIDILLAHPALGLVAIEVKGWSLGQIQRVENQEFVVAHRTGTKTENPLGQADKARRHFVGRIDKKHGEPIAFEVVAFPRITQEEWANRGYDLLFPQNNIVLSDDLLDGGAGLARKLKAEAQLIVGRGRKRTPLTAAQGHALREALGCSASFAVDRPARSAASRALLGQRLDELASMERMLTDEQEELSRIRVGGKPWLIRGVAGSGKSVVLARLVARTLARIVEPEQFRLPLDEHRAFSLGIVCFNRPLVPMLTEQIRHFYRDITHSDLPAVNLNVFHFNGLMNWMARRNYVDYVKVGGGSSREERAQLYLKQLQQYESTEGSAAAFDALFIDEGQDLSEIEYRVLLKLVHERGGRVGDRSKAMVIFYDDAQNIYGRGRPNWHDLGIGVVGRTRVMKRSYRSSRQTLAVAFNVLLGTGADATTRGASMRDFADLAYLEREGMVEMTEGWCDVKFSEQDGPVPIVRPFPSRAAEQRWLCEEVERLIVKERVRPEDILVVYGIKASWESLDEALRERLGDNVKKFVRPDQDEGDKDQRLIAPGSLAVTTVASAKGYDAYIVFLVGVDQLDADAHGRATFYVAATRAKYQLYVSGIAGSPLLVEADKAAAEARTRLLA